MKQVNFTLETARQFYISNNPESKQFALDNYTKDELEETVFPKTWKELRGVIGWYIDGSSEILEYSNFICTDNNKNIFPTKELAAAALALSQLLQLRDKYNGGWVADWGNNTLKYTILIYNNKLYKGFNTIDSRVMSFKTAELRNEFFNNFQELLTLAMPLL